MRVPAASDAVSVVVALGVAYALKSFYATASVEDLSWILRPTAAVVSLVSGVRFEEEAGAGYLSRELRFLIAPACAGMNFLIAAFLTAIFGFLGRLGSLRARLGLFCMGAAIAYAATVIANAIRISIAILLHRSPPFPFREELHRIEGIVVYFVALCMLFVGAHVAIDRWQEKRAEIPG